MKVKTKFGWFEMSDIFSIDNPKIQKSFNHYNPKLLEKIETSFNVYSKYESAIRTLSEKTIFTDILDTTDSKAWDDTELIKDEIQKEKERDLILEKMNKQLEEAHQKKYDDFVNLWLENK